MSRGLARFPKLILFYYILFLWEKLYSLYFKSPTDMGIHLTVWALTAVERDKMQNPKAKYSRILHRSKFRIIHAERCLCNELFESQLNKVESKCWKTRGLFTWMGGGGGKVGEVTRSGASNPPVHIISHLI